jgi:hypothetical protein
MPWNAISRVVVIRARGAISYNKVKDVIPKLMMTFSLMRDWVA